MPLNSGIRMWSEFIVRVLIIRSNLPLAVELVDGKEVPLISYRTGNQVSVNHNSIELPMNKVPLDDHANKAFRARKLSSVLDLFVHEGSQALINGCMPDTAVVMAWPLSNTVVQLDAKAPSSPTDLVATPMLIHHVFETGNAHRTGIDFLLFVRRAICESTQPEGLVAVGIHCVSSCSSTRTVLTAFEVETSRMKFHTNMLARGWSEHALILVVLADCELSDKAEFMSQVGNNVVVLDKGEMANWLGPSLVDMFQSMRDASLAQSARLHLDNLMEQYARSDSKAK